MRSKERRFFDLNKTSFPQIGPDAFWIVGMGMKIRHATEVRPGALPAGEWIPTLCDEWIRVPCSTPYEQDPHTKHVTTRCNDCAEQVNARDLSCTVWDF